MTLDVGSGGLAQVPGGNTSNEDDLRGYRELLASSDEFEDSAPAPGPIASRGPGQKVTRIPTVGAVLLS
jgi:hypothetical protein